jgi:hypothetical protein
MGTAYPARTACDRVSPRSQAFDAALGKYRPACRNGRFRDDFHDKMPVILSREKNESSGYFCYGADAL